MHIESILFPILCKRSDRKRDAGLKTPVGIRRFDDISYGPHRRWNRLDVYRPEDAPGKLPVIVSVHGGGWVYGDKELYQHYCMSLAEHGFAVVNFSYRLAPRHKFPAQLEDVCRVFAWVTEHAARYGFDPDNVFAVGDSAGAHLLGLFCCLCTNPDYARELPLPVPKGFAPRAAALNCGVYRFERSASGKRDSAMHLVEDLLPRKGTPEELRLISVTGHLTGAFPPCIVMTAEGDFLADQAKPLADRLRELGAEAEYRFYGDPEHPLGHVFHCSVRLPEALRCNLEECEFFRAHMNTNSQKRHV